MRCLRVCAALRAAGSMHSLSDQTRAFLVPIAHLCDYFNSVAADSEILPLQLLNEGNVGCLRRATALVQIGRPDMLPCSVSFKSFSRANADSLRSLSVNVQVSLSSLAQSLRPLSCRERERSGVYWSCKPSLLHSHLVSMNQD